MNCKQNHESFDSVAVFYVHKLKDFFFFIEEERNIFSSILRAI